MSFPLPPGLPCYFCEIISHRADQWNVIDRADSTITLLNGRQFEIGQCIIAPIRHAPTIVDLEQAEANAIMAEAKRLTEAMLRAYEPDGVLLYQNNGLGSGQEVPHFHLHVVPRRSGSDWGIGPPQIARLEAERRPAHLDHEAVTEAKLRTVEELRREL